MSRSSRSKGQWFLISAVIAVSAFLSISIVLKDFFVIDSSVTARNREDQYMWNIKEQFENVVEKSSCTEMDANLNEYMNFVKNRLWESGYLVYIEYAHNPQNRPPRTKDYSYTCQDDDPATLPIEPRIRNIGKGLLVATEDAVFSNNINPDDIIK